MTTYDFSSLDFDELKATLIEYIKTSDEFKDYEFEGSALNSIASLLTYVTLQQNYYLNMTTQELYLNTATIYKNAVAIAKSLNYIPHRKQSATITTTIAFDQLEASEFLLDAGQPVVIPANCKFDVEGVEFTTTTSYNVYTQDPLEIKLYQRTIIEETFTFDGSTIELLYGIEADEGYMNITVDGIQWSEYLNDIDANEDSEIYFIDNNLNDKLELSFGDNIIGKTPTVGNTIVVTYGYTLGVAGNNLNEIALNQNVYSGIYTYTSSDCTVVSVYSSGGSAEETIQSIKANAPKFYEAQNRAVTKQDYETLLTQVSFLETINVWDGANELPPTYGTVFATFKPTSGDDILTADQKTTVTSFIQDYMPMTLRFVIKDPIYIYLDIVSTVYYYETLNVDTTVIRGEIETNIDEYFTLDMTLTDTTLKYSQLIKTIDDVTEVSNNLTDINCFIKFDRASTASNSYVFDIGNGIEPSSVDNTLIQDDGLGNIILKSDLSIIGSIGYASGEFNWILAGMDATDNVLYFDTAIKDISFVKNNLPVLNSIAFTFEGV